MEFDQIEDININIYDCEYTPNFTQNIWTTFAEIHTSKYKPINSDVFMKIYINIFDF